MLKAIKQHFCKHKNVWDSVSPEYLMARDKDERPILIIRKCGDCDKIIDIKYSHSGPAHSGLDDFCKIFNIDKKGK